MNVSNDEGSRAELRLEVKTMKYSFYVEQAIGDYTTQLGQLVRFYLEHRLRALGKTEPDFEDLQRSRSKAIESLFIMQSDDKQLTFDADLIRRACSDNDPKHWRNAKELASELQGCSQ